jgi:hypothetical protein
VVHKKANPKYFNLILGSHTVDYVIRERIRRVCEIGSYEQRTRGFTYPQIDRDTV